MSRSLIALALAGALAAAPMLEAQQPAPAQPPAGRVGRRQAIPRPVQGPARRPMQGPAAGLAGRGDAASMFLARTGELRLTDAQVTRLAAIARRAADRRRALRARVDSLRAAAPVANAPAAGQPLRADLERMREQARADLRDALAVLTPDQQAQAWEAMAMRRGMAGPGPNRPAPRRQGPPGER